MTKQKLFFSVTGRGTFSSGFNLVTQQMLQGNNCPMAPTRKTAGTLLLEMSGCFSPR